MEIQVRKGLVLRPRTVDEANNIFAVIDANRAHLRQWLPWVDSTNSTDDVKAVITRWEEQEKNGSDFVFGIMENGQYVGNIGLHDIERRLDTGMIGYWLAADAQGRGIMTDCVRAVLDFGFLGLNLNRIYINAVVENRKSRAIPERLDFVHEGTIQDGAKLYGQFYDLTMYGMLRRNWTKNAVNGYRNSAWLYDLDNRDHLKDDIPFYLEYAERLGGNVLELACGTGRVALQLAAAGHMVTGLDLSYEMLAQLQMKLDGFANADKIRTVYGNMADFQFENRFNLIIAPFRAFQALTEEADIRSCLRLVREHLTENGRFIINVFRPYAQQLDQSWCYPETVRWEIDDGDKKVSKADWGDKIDTDAQVMDVHYAFTITYADGSTERVLDDLRLKYHYEQQLRAYLAEAGFVIHEAFGWYDKSQIENNREFIFVCGRA